MTAPCRACEDFNGLLRWTFVAGLVRTSTDTASYRDDVTGRLQGDDLSVIAWCGATDARPCHEEFTDP